MNSLNSQLYASKKEIISRQWFFKRGTFPYAIDVIYHGVPLRIHTKKEILGPALKNLVPQNWLKSHERPHEVFLLEPTDFGIDIERWSNEASQDCFYPDRETGIQRDFAARTINDHSTVVVCENSLSDGFYNFLRWFLPKRLMANRKLILHSSCVVDSKGLAYVFLGHSGAGKSTVASLRDHRDTLGDDMNIVCFENGTPFIQAGAIGGLFNSTLGYNEKFPISGFFWLIQDEETKMVKCNSAEANRKLLSSFANLPWEQLNQLDFKFLFSSAEELALTAPVYNMHFKKDRDFWSYVCE